MPQNTFSCINLKLGVVKSTIIRSIIKVQIQLVSVGPQKCDKVLFSFVKIMKSTEN